MPPASTSVLSLQPGYTSQPFQNSSSNWGPSTQICEHIDATLIEIATDTVTLGLMSRCRDISPALLLGSYYLRAGYVLSLLKKSCIPKSRKLIIHAEGTTPTGELNKNCKNLSVAAMAKPAKTQEGVLQQSN